jgi:hypothetical protein
MFLAGAGKNPHGQWFFVEKNVESFHQSPVQILFSPLANTGRFLLKRVTPYLSAGNV